MLKTLFIWEGVTYYITARAVDDTLGFIAGHSCKGSSVVFDYYPPSVADGTCMLKEARSMRAAFERFGEGLTFGIDPAAVDEFLFARGFGCISNFSRENLKSKYLGKANGKRKLSEIFYIVHASVL